MTPGTIVCLNGQCAWPERRGMLATVVNTAGAEKVYPVHGLGPTEVIIHIPGDPLLRPHGADALTNGEVWSCAVPIACLDVVEP